MSSPTVSHDAVLANIKAATSNVLQGFHTGTSETLLPNTSESFRYHLNPATVKTAPKSRAEFINFWESFMAPNLIKFEAQLRFEAYDVENRRSTLYLVSTADTPLGKATWKNEVVFMMQFSEDGKTLLRLDEMYVIPLGLWC